MKKQINKEYGWGFYISILITLGLLSMIFAGIMSLSVDNGISSESGNVALIPLKGIIVGDASTGLLSESVTSSTDIIKMIEKADADDRIKAIVFEIDSPGGMVVPTDEIAQAIKRSNKTTVSWIRSVGASGAYWIATSTDRIYAQRMSVVGSIGVISSYLQFSGLLDQYNVTYERLVSGEYKDMGSPFKNLTSSERNIYQSMIDRMREEFIDEVSKNRNLDRAKVSELATGQVYLGIDAKEYGLIDEIGSKEEINIYLKKKLNLTEINYAIFRKDASLWQKLRSSSEDNYYYIGKGIGASFVERSSIPNSPGFWT